MNCGAVGCLRRDASFVCGWDDRPLCPVHAPADPDQELCDAHHRLIRALLNYAQPPEDQENPDTAPRP